jgi:mitosis inhibitor protein kinase SWE1
MQEMCTVTPSPPAHVRTYPFADGAGAKTKSHLSADSPSPPHKRFSILSRLKSAKQQRPLSRPSNPLLSLAYKIGGEQQARGLVSATRSPGKDDISQGRFEQDFVVLQPVGEGEFSTVWKVRGKRTGEIFAVKRGKAFTGGKDR